MQGRLCVPNMDGLQKLILEEAHSSQYSIHSGAAKMYQDLRQHYWWRRMKKDIVRFVAKCLNCQQVKYKHQRPGRLLQRMDILEWKWERVTMDCSWAPTDFEKVRCYLGDCRSADYVRALHSCVYYLFFRAVGKDLYLGDCSFAWCPSFHYFR